ncbi:MAG: type II toxin-antitoxin system Phd/YefM family antitoxin [Candidatus Omnitrophota bacterium]
MISYSISQAKTHLPELIRKADRTYESFLITKNGSPKAVLMSCDELEGLLETIEILNDSKLAASIRKARKDAMAGKVAAFKDIKRI